MGRPSNTEERREQIVSGLLAVMAERGYEGATIVAIAKAAGLKSGLVHYHFENKRAILVALVERLVSVVERRYQTRLANGADSAAARLDAWIDAQLGLGPDGDLDAVAAWVFIGGESIRQPEVRPIYEREMEARISQVCDLVREVLVSEGRSSAQAAELASLVVAAVEGAYHLGATVPGALSRGFAAPYVQRAVHGLIAAEPKLKSG